MATLTRKIVAEQAQQVRDQDARGNYETAHAIEDELREKVLIYYANGGTDPELAFLALDTNLDENDRWCA